MITNNENTQEISNGLDNVIKESKIEIENETKKKEFKTRGRPKKDGTSTPKLSQNFVNPPSSQPMSKDSYKAILGGGLNLLNMYLNKYTGTELFTLTKEEHETITEMGGSSLMDFMPTVNPVYMNAIGFACIMGGIYGMKYHAYNEYVKSLKKEVVEVKQ